LQRDRPHRVETVVLHLRVECRRLHSQQSCRARLVPVAVVERGFDQLDFIPLDLVVEIDAFVIEFDLPVAIAIGRKFDL